MIHVLLSGALAAQATPASAHTTPAAAPTATRNCRAADGRYIMSCYPPGVVKKMGAQSARRSGRLLVAAPDTAPALNAKSE